MPETPATSPGIDRAAQRRAARCAENRAGNPRALAHLYEALIHEHVVLAAASSPTDATLSRPQLHDFID
jgi:hypothetical protein